MPDEVLRILILGGTEEARLLASRLADDTRYYAITSLAGRTASPNEIAGEVRSGGFGGVAGLRDFIAKNHIALIVDATHPYAVQISANAMRTNVPCLRLERPPWQPETGDNWSLAANIDAAAQALPKGARALVTVGRQEIAPFLARADIYVVARMIERPGCETPDNVEILLARPPFSCAQERALMQDKRIDVLVTKNSGGEASYAKLQAARALGLPVIMIDRPDKVETVTAASVGQMLNAIELA